MDPILGQWVADWIDDDQAYYELQQDPKFAKSRYNITPGSTIPVARKTSKGPTIEMAKWAFPFDGRYVFNTRSETALTSPMWRGPIRTGRCVVPVTGFYEWKQKAPFFIHRADGQPLLLAGVTGWAEHRDEERFCASILTCAPAGPMVGLHDRMPVVLDAADAERWAGPLDDAEITALAVPNGAGLEAYPVDKRVGDVANDDPGLIKPIPTL